MHGSDQIKAASDASVKFRSSRNRTRSGHSSPAGGQQKNLVPCGSSVRFVALTSDGSFEPISLSAQRKVNTMNRKLATRLALLTLTAGAFISVATATAVVAPNGDANSEGNTNNVAPFSAGWFGSNPTARYQQVYGSNQFGGSSIDIGAIAFRFDSIVAPGTETDVFPDVQIDLSTSSSAPDQLSTTFANNVGANNSVVYSGSLTLTGSALGQSPNPFDLIINLQTPFLYNPSQGNLLLDISIDGAGSFPISTLDADNTSGDGTSRVWTPSSGSANDPTGNADTFGLVTEFLPATAAPEPSSLGLGALGVIAAYLICRGKIARS